MGERHVLVLKGPMEVIYTGLRRMVGAPGDFGKNNENNRFPNVEAAILIEET